MKRRSLSKEELNRIIYRRQKKYSWLKIERETGIPRRMAKRAYERWEKTRVSEDLKAARIHVAEGLLREHLDNLLALAHNLVLHLPSKAMLFENKTADGILEEILGKDIRQRIDSDRETVFTGEREQRHILRENHLLFDSLRTHSVENVRWSELDTWKREWNEVVQLQQTIGDKARELINNIVDNYKEKEFTEALFTGKEGDDLRNKMVDGVTESVWWGILDEEPKEGYNNIRIKAGRGEEKVVAFGKGGSIVYITLLDYSAVENISEMCRRAAEIICKEDEVRWAVNTNRAIARAAESLELDLEPVKLKPILLRTRCDLCPA